LLKFKLSSYTVIEQSLRRGIATGNAVVKPSNPIDIHLPDNHKSEDIWGYCQNRSWYGGYGYRNGTSVLIDKFQEMVPVTGPAEYKKQLDMNIHYCGKRL
jgi:hypothetical protein